MSVERKSRGEGLKMDTCNIGRERGDLLEGGREREGRERETEKRGNVYVRK